MAGNGTGRLDSWKEIAEYVGRDKRTAMRWADQGMPVRRDPAQKRGRVFAFRHEIEAWLLKQRCEPGKSTKQIGSEPAALTATEPASGAESSRPEVSLPPTELVAAPRSARFSRSHMAIAAAAVLLVVVGLAVGRLRSASSGARELFAVKLGAQSVEAEDAAGHRLWSYPLPGPVSEEYFRHAPEYSRIRIEDFLNDGKKEAAVLVAMEPKSSGTEYAQTALDFFGASGKLMWSYVPDETFHFGTHELKGPWGLMDIFTGGSGKGLTLWAAAAHHTWSNSIVAQLDPRTGRDTVRFVNTGILYRLNEIRTKSTTYLVAGGFNNEWDGGSLAILDERRPFASSPQTKGTRHFCDSCPAGAPDYYFVFPRSEVNRLSGVYQDPILAIRLGEDGLEVTKEERIYQGKETTIYLFRGEPPFSLLSVRYDSGYDMLHKEWSAEGKIGHSLENCPERLNPEPVRLWTPASGWSEIPVKPARADQ